MDPKNKLATEGSWEAKKKRAPIDITDFDSLKVKITKKVGVGAEQAKIDRELSKDVDLQKAQDIRHDQKLTRMKEHFEVLQWALTP